MTDEIIERPPILVYSDDLNRLRNFGVRHRLGDSAVALRRLLDAADTYDKVVLPGTPFVGIAADDLAAIGKRADTLVGAFVVIGQQLDAIDALPWWKRRARRRHLLAIRETLRLVR